MKYLVLAFIAIVYIQCQAPTINPATTSCAISSTCVTNGGVCGNSSGPFSATKYCGTAASFCDYAFSGKCTAKYANSAACNSTYYAGGDCQSGICTSGTCQPTPTYTTAVAPTVTILYEGATCTGSYPYCHSSLDCVGGVCQKWFASGVGSNCNIVLDCAPGNLCVSGQCATQTGTAIGAPCTADSSCNTQLPATGHCICNAPGASAGVCGSLDQINGFAFTGAAVTNCAALVNQYKNGGTITASNSNTAAANYVCVQACAYLNGPSAVTAAWAGNNGVYTTIPPTGSITSCVYTPPTKCSNPTTTGPTKASATSVIASLLLTIVALLF